MREPEIQQPNPELKALIVEASQALARLDTMRLEELALSCQALNRRLAPGETDAGMRKGLARQSADAVADMAVFGRVLEATRANLKVMDRLRELRAGRLEYSEQRTAEGWSAAQLGGGHGDH